MIAIPQPFFQSYYSIKKIMSYAVRKLEWWYHNYALGRFHRCHDNEAVVAQEERGTVPQMRCLSLAPRTPKSQRSVTRWATIESGDLPTKRSIRGDVFRSRTRTPPELSRKFCLLHLSLSLPRNRGVSSFQGNLQLARGADSFGWTWELTRLPIYERTTPPLLRPNFSHWQPNWFNWTTRIFQFVARSRGTQRVAKRTSVSPPQAIDFPGAKL